MSELRVGAETQAWCTSCRAMREHVIVAMVEKRPAKVECDICHKQHLYKAGPPGTKASGGSDGATRAVSSRSRRAMEPIKPPAPAVDVSALVAGREATPYDANVSFGMGEVVRHPAFGIGVVTALPGAQKMEVTFTTAGAKLLAHARAASSPSTMIRPTRREDDGRTLPSDAPPRRS